MKYKHLSYSDRQEMEKLYLQGWHMNDIAEKLGVSLATVYHERARGDTGRMDKNGRGGEDLVIEVPVGTQIFLETGRMPVLDEYGDEMADALEAWIGENAARLGQNDRLTTRDDTAPAGTSA